MSNTATIIQLKDVCKDFPGPQGTIHALRHIQFDVKQGEIFGIIGPSGAGKSTLIRTINALERPTSGQVWVDDVELLSQSASGLRRLRRSIGMIFQHFNLLSSRNVYRNVAFPLELAKTSRKEIESVITPLLELVGLQDKHKAYPSQLSGGQKQRVAIARALALQPKVLLCDEATSSLDPQSTQSILALLKDINQRLGLTLVMITHEMGVIKQICDRVAVIEKGEIVETGSVYSVFADPKHAVTNAMLDAFENVDMHEVLGERTLSPDPTKGQPVLRLSFFGEGAEQPIVANLSQRFQVVPNILHANMERIQSKLLGIMIIELISIQDGQLDDIISYLKQQGIQVKVLGYVADSR